MADLLQSAQLFEVSVRLQTASSCLNAVSVGEVLDSDGEETLEWAGAFLVQVDWTSNAEKKGGIEGGLAVPATNTRPKFYASLVKLAPKFEEVGIDSDEKLSRFLQRIYSFLISGGQSQPKPTPEEIRLIANLLHLLSESIIVDLTGNGLPREETVLSVGFCG